MVWQTSIAGAYVRSRGRVDANQVSVVKALRKAGCRVLSLANVGGGVPDLLVYRAGVLTMLEIKDGNKFKSQQKLTSHQERFRVDWPVQVVNSIESALKAVGL
jgi:Holliday junction resolvase